MTAAPEPGHRRGEAVGERILGAAREILLAEGYGGLSIEAVVERTGVAKTTVYRRYRNKADLATAALAEFAGVADVPAPEDPRAGLVEFLRVFRERMAAGGLGVLGSMLDDRADPEALELHRERVIQPRMRIARALLEAARDRGEIRADADLDLALTMMIGSFFAAQIAGLADDEDWAERAVDQVLAGLAPR